jgi:ankyrin repeat protein
VQLLLQHGADMQFEDEDGYDALRLASQNGSAAVVQLLIQHGANARDPLALQWASQYGHAEVVQLLLQHGAVLPSDT